MAGVEPAKKNGAACWGGDIRGPKKKGRAVPDLLIYPVKICFGMYLSVKLLFGR